MTNKKPINKDNPKNIYCAHCKHWVIGTTVKKYGSLVCYCSNRESKFAAQERNYWNRCKHFEWRAEDGK